MTRKPVGPPAPPRLGDEAPDPHPAPQDRQPVTVPVNRGGPLRSFAKPTGPDDVEGWCNVLRAYCEGDPWAFHELIATTAKGMMKQCAAARLTRDESWDVVVDTMLLAWSLRLDFEGDLDRFRARTSGILGNQILHAVRSRGRRAGHEVLDGRVLEAAEPQSLDDTVERNERKRFLQENLPRLPLTQQRVMVLALQGKSWDEIAAVCSEEERTSVNADAARTRHACAMKTLQRWADPAFVRPGIAPAPMDVFDLMQRVVWDLPADPQWGNLRQRQHAEMEVHVARDAHRPPAPWARPVADALAELARRKAEDAMLAEDAAAAMESGRDTLPDGIGGETGGTGGTGGG